MIRPIAILATSLLSVCCASKPSLDATKPPASYQRPIIDCTQQWPSDALPCQAVREAEDRNVWISSLHGRDWYYCSGVIVSTNHILTAGHCFGDKIFVDGNLASVLREDHANDLMLLLAKTKDFAALIVNTSPSVSQIVYSAANHEPRMGIFTVSRITYIDEDQVCMGTLAAGGVSGSGVFDVEGRLVSIAQAAQSAHFDLTTAAIVVSIGANPKRIQAFLGANP